MAVIDNRKNKLTKRIEYGEFGRLVLAVIPLLVLAMYMGMQQAGLIPKIEVTKAAETMMCESWKSVKINGCSWEEYSMIPRPQKCITSSTTIALNLDPPSGANRIMWSEVDSETNCNQAVNIGWHQLTLINNNPNIDIDRSVPGNRKICLYFLGADSLSNQCGAMIAYQPPLPTSLTCKSWENVTVNGCTQSSWDKFPRSAACVVSKSKIPVSLNNKGATYFKYTFVPPSKNCSTVDLSGFPLNPITTATVNYDLPDCTKDDGLNCQTKTPNELKLCVQFFNNSAKSPVCGSMIEYREQI